MAINDIYQTSPQSQSPGNPNEIPSPTGNGAYVLLGLGDTVVSNDSVTAPMWSSNNPTLNIFYTSSTQVSSNVQEYYTTIFQTASTEVTAEIQFDIAYGDQVGSGSQFLNSLVTGSTPTRTNYGQYRNLVLGNEDASFVFGGVTSSYWYAMPIERARYKQTILPGTWTLKLQGYNDVLSTTVQTNVTIVGTALSGASSSPHTVAVGDYTVKYADGTLAPVDPTVPAAIAPFGVKKVAITVVHTATSITSVAFAASSENFQPGMIITIAATKLGSGSSEVSFRILKEYMAGTEVVTLTDDSKLTTTTQFSDAGRIYQIISGSAGVLGGEVKNTNGYTGTSGSYGYMLPDINTLILNGEALDSSMRNGGINFGTSRSFDSKGLNALSMVDTLNRGGQFTINSKEDLSSDYIFCRAKNSEYNYSANPSFISSSTGAVVFPSFVENPTTYITTVGLYNISQELLAVAKLSRPLEKNFTKELLVRVKLDF